MLQQHQGESLSEAWTRFKDLLQKVPHHGIDLWLQIQIFYDHVNPVASYVIKNDVESWALLEDLALYNNESWNDPRDFAKPVKAISMPHDVPSTSDRRLNKLENQVQHAKTSRFEADFKQYQSEVTNKLDTFLKAFNDQIPGLLPSDTVKNPKLNTNPTSSPHSHLTGDPQIPSNSFKSVNAIQTCFNSNTCDKKNQLPVNTLTVSEDETPTLKEP
ncbi:hypothetical protein Tco_1046986 [Tanacetum coccineum]